MSDPAGLEARLARLEDVRAIEALKGAYCAALDSGYDLDALARLLDDDARWVADGFEDLRGTDAIRDFFGLLARQVVRVRHYATTPAIELDPDGGAADARWSMLCLCTRRHRADPDREFPIIEFGTYRDRLVKRDGRWRFVEIAVEVAYAGPLGASS